MSVIKKFVTAGPDLTARDLGVSPKYFELHIENKPLLVVEEMKEISLIKDEEGEEYSVRRELVQDLKG